MPKVPSDFERGIHLVSISVARVGSEFGKVYSGARITIRKLPFVRILD